VNILVTGGAGFIGSHVVDAYVQLGHQVSIIDNLSTGRERNINPKATLYKGDVRDAQFVREILERGRFDAVNHHAAQIDVRRSVADPAFDAAVNIVGVINILESSIRSHVARFIFSSTGGAIYGEQDYFPADELHPTRPISPYGIAKLSTEHYLFYYRVVHGLQTVILRYGNIYGPRQNPEGEAGVVAIFVSKMLSGGQPIINGDGKQTRDYVYVGDVARANVDALSYAGSNTFNIGTGVETDVNTIFRILNDAMGQKCEERHGDPKKGEQQRSLLNSGRIQKETGWKPLLSLEEGLKRTVEYFEQVG
jgi:UDP-glucose 4-epimerase